MQQHFDKLLDGENREVDIVEKMHEEAEYWLDQAREELEGKPRMTFLVAKHCTTLHQIVQWVNELTQESVPGHEDYGIDRVLSVQVLPTADGAFEVLALVEASLFV